MLKAIAVPFDKDSALVSDSVATPTDPFIEKGPLLEKNFSGEVKVPVRSPDFVSDELMVRVVPASDFQVPVRLSQS